MTLVSNFELRTFLLQFLVESQHVEDKIDYDENRNLILKYEIDLLKFCEICGELPQQPGEDEVLLTLVDAQ